MTQDKKHKSDIFIERASRLLAYAKKKNEFRTKVALAEYTEISRSTLYDYLDKKREPTQEAFDKLAEAEVKIGMVPKIEGNKPPRFGSNTDSSLKLNPAFALPAAAPSAQDCLDHLNAFLSEAQHVPGLIGHTLIELRDRFSVEKAKRLRDAAELES